MTHCNFIVAKKASNDLEDIYDYGLQEWGAGQAADYILSIGENLGIQSARRIPASLRFRYANRFLA